MKELKKGDMFLLSTWAGPRVARVLFTGSSDDLSIMYFAEFFWDDKVADNYVPKADDDLYIFMLGHNDLMMAPSNATQLIQESKTNTKRDPTPFKKGDKLLVSTWKGPRLTKVLKAKEVEGAMTYMVRCDEEDCNFLVTHCELFIAR